MAWKNLIYEVDEHVATVTLNRPETLNAVNEGLHDELGQVCAQINADHAVRVALITGAGRGFCSGGDVREMRMAGGGVVAPILQNPAEHWLGRLLAVTKPTIAVINGVAAGGGLALALACDLRIASDRARFSAIFARIGMPVLDGCGGLLWRAVGLEKALEMLFTAEIIDAAEAGRIGLVGRVVPHDELMLRARELAGRIAAGPPVALQLTKSVVYDSLDKTFLEHLPTQ
jgi:2-(1,2-epoxy-1,2-dihydrophenyl)acetyl-CoA isomerase